MKRSFLWITDPWNTLDHPRETTLRWMEESLVLGMSSYWCDIKSIRFEEGRVCLEAQNVEGVFPGRKKEAFRLGEKKIFSPTEFRQIHYRPDPPVNQAYLYPLQLLSLALEKSRRTELVNPASALFSANEKFEAATLHELMPETLIASQWETFENFGRKQGQTVLKPLHQAQSKGVELLNWTTTEGIQRARELIETMQGPTKTPILLQKYLPGILAGETRLWFVDGKLLASAHKKPKAGEFKIDMDHGATVSVHELTSAEARAAKQIGKRLKARKIRLAAVDLIEGLVTDYNFTSPGLIVQMEDALGENLSKKILKALI
jgi:glutathione synthase